MYGVCVSCSFKDRDRESKIKVPGLKKANGTFTTFLIDHPPSSMKSDEGSITEKKLLYYLYFRPDKAHLVATHIHISNVLHINKLCINCKSIGSEPFVAHISTYLPHKHLDFNNGLKRCNKIYEV